MKKVLMALVMVMMMSTVVMAAPSETYRAKGKVDLWNVLEMPGSDGLTEAKGYASMRASVRGDYLQAAGHVRIQAKDANGERFSYALTFRDRGMRYGVNLISDTEDQIQFSAKARGISWRQGERPSIEYGKDVVITYDKVAKAFFITGEGINVMI